MKNKKSAIAFSTEIRMSDIDGRVEASSFVLKFTCFPFVAMQRPWGLSSVLP
jgi:hypothetical protein